MFEKTCTKCGETKPVTEFHKTARCKSGFSGRCKICAASVARAWYEANKDCYGERVKARYGANKDSKNRQTKAWYGANKERRGETVRAWRETNKDRYREAAKRLHRDRVGVDLTYAASVSARHIIRSSMYRMNFTKRSKTADLLGCDWATFEHHLSSKFADGMSWANRSEWHIDHVTPLATAQTIEDVERLCHYTNLQPLWAADNLRKGAKIMT